MIPLFWLLWSIECALALWWVGSEMGYQYLKPNPFSFLALLYLALVLVVRFALKWTVASNVMVLIPAIPLFFMLLIILVSVFGGGKWN